MRLFHSKHRSFLLLLCSIIILSLSALSWRFFTRGYYSVFAVTYDSYNYPFITAQFQDQNIPLAVRVGSRFPLSLSKKTLDAINKQPHGTILKYCFDNSEHEFPSFLIPEIKIGNLVLKNSIASQAFEGDPDILGKFLGEEFNFLLDFPHSRIIACDSFSKLQAKGLVEKNWLPIPFTTTSSGPVIQIDTDFGKCNLFINTAATLGYIRSSLVSSEDSIISSFLSFQEHALGEARFQPCTFPDKLNEIDGFIGMDFLKKRSFYIDNTHQIIYVEPSPTYFERLPVTLGDRNLFMTDVSVEGKHYSLDIDLGSYFAFALSQEILNDIHKVHYGTTTWKDFKGNQYESPIYQLNEIKIGNLNFSDLLIKQTREEFYTNASFYSMLSQPLGVIGQSILKKYNLFLDFRHSAIYASNTHKDLQKRGLMSNNLLVIPFTLHKDGILLSVEMDSGIKRLFLDTGATHTGVRAPHATSTSRFCLMGHDFGKRAILSIDIHPSPDHDGFIGLDFLREYSLFIDYPHRRIFLDLDSNLM